MSGYYVNPNAHSLAPKRSAIRFENEFTTAHLNTSSDMQETSPNSSRLARRNMPYFGIRPLKSLRSPDKVSPSKRLMHLKSGEFEAPVEHTGINLVRTSAGLKPIESLQSLNQLPELNNKIFEELVDRHVPCLLLTPLKATNRIVVFYHANAEDLADARYFCQRLNLLLDVDLHHQCFIFIVEYPGYSLYVGEPSEDCVLADIEPVYTFLTQVMDFLPEDLVVMGRSLGTGPATYMSSQHRCGGLVLVSPFTSIQSVVRSNYGDLLSRLVKDRFNNEERISKVACPVLFIHGKEDEYIPDGDSRRLFGMTDSLRKAQRTIRGADSVGHDPQALRHPQVHRSADMQLLIEVPPPMGAERLQSPGTQVLLHHPQQELLRCIDSDQRSWQNQH